MVDVLECDVEVGRAAPAVLEVHLPQSLRHDVALLPVADAPGLGA
nr:hypothetical protein [Streptomyces europaeiscabiei]